MAENRDLSYPAYQSLQSTISISPFCLPYDPMNTLGPCDHSDFRILLVSSFAKISTRINSPTLPLLDSHHHRLKKKKGKINCKLCIQSQFHSLLCRGADEELLLLEGIEMYGLVSLYLLLQFVWAFDLVGYYYQLVLFLDELLQGNWSDVALHVDTKTKAMCEQHYNDVYLSSASAPLPVRFAHFDTWSSGKEIFS